ncbi:MAG: 7-carboxy-7-deazaguanine synthase QueE [Chryseolinea sp.]
MVQAQEKISSTTLPLMEDFYTIQGEGYYQGSAAYFIRLGGCDVGCFWCDVKESWDASSHPAISVEEMTARAIKTNTNIVVVTGGEPLMYDLEPLTTLLRSKGLRTHIETSGAYPISGDWDWICLSPKKFKVPHESAIKNADELKVIVFNKNDFDWGLEFVSQLKPGCQLFLQPEWSKEKEMLPLIIDYVKANPKWQISLQVHKYMSIP